MGKKNEDREEKQAWGKHRIHKKNKKQKNQVKEFSSLGL